MNIGAAVILLFLLMSCFLTHKILVNKKHCSSIIYLILGK